jgi:peptidoglycan/LPS O-acetylase OafA/YrhL
MTFFVLLKNHGVWPLIEGGLWAAFVLGLLVLPLHTRRVFVNTPLEFFGRISYSLYLIHYPLNILTGTMRYHARVAIFGTGERTLWIAAVDMVVLWTLAIGLGWLSYRYIEQPFVSLKDRIGKSA